jgi:hypothetical protein
MTGWGVRVHAFEMARQQRLYASIVKVTGLYDGHSFWTSLLASPSARMISRKSASGFETSVEIESHCGVTEDLYARLFRLKRLNQDLFLGSRVLHKPDPVSSPNEQAMERSRGAGQPLSCRSTADVDKSLLVSDGQPDGAFVEQ